MKNKKTKQVYRFFNWRVHALSSAFECSTFLAGFHNVLCAFCHADEGTRYQMPCTPDHTCQCASRTVLSRVADWCRN